MNIYQSVQSIMEEVEPIAKARKNDTQGYKFRGIDDIYNELNPHLAKYGVFFCPEIISKEREERTTKSGGALIYTVLIVAFTVYAGDGSFVKLVTIGEAMDSGDKSANKAMSAAYKYAMMQLFCIPTEDEKDTEVQTHEVAPSVKSPSAPGSSENTKCGKCGATMVAGKGGAPYCVECYKRYKESQKQIAGDMASG